MGVSPNCTDLAARSFYIRTVPLTLSKDAIPLLVMLFRDSPLSMQTSSKNRTLVPRSRKTSPLSKMANSQKCFLFYLALCYSSVANAVFPKFRPRPVDPKPMDPITPNEEPPPHFGEKPDVPDRFPAPGKSVGVFNPYTELAEPAPTLSSGPVQTQMARLEQNIMKELGKEAASTVVEQVASALLGLGDGSDAPCKCMLLSVLYLELTWCKVTITTTRMNMMSYAPCISYASILSSCAAATPGLLAKSDHEAQASCACYTSTAPCDTTTYSTAFDSFASRCEKYLRTEGNYIQVASAMATSSIIGLGFCGSVNAAILIASSRFGLPAALSPATCATTTTSLSAQAGNATKSQTIPSIGSNEITGSAPSSRHVPVLTPFDHNVLVCFHTELIFNFAPRTDFVQAISGLITVVVAYLLSF